MSEKAETVTARAGVASLPPGPAIRRTPRHRRPTGAPPPLPHPVSVTTRAWLAIFAVPAVFGIEMLLPANARGVTVTLGAPTRAPDCGTGHAMILAAQAVPSAAFLPCIAALPSGWTTAGTDAEIASGRASFVLNSGQAGLQAVTITLTATCNIAGAQQIRSGQPGMRQFERPLSLVPRYSAVRYYIFPGGCATYQFAFAPGGEAVAEITGILGPSHRSH